MVLDQVHKNDSDRARFAHGAVHEDLALVLDCGF